MNPELSNTLISILNDITTNVSTAKNFVLGELPDVIQQLLTWKLMNFIVLYVLCILVLIASIFIYRTLMTIDRNTMSTFQKNAVCSWYSDGTYTLKDQHQLLVILSVFGIGASIIFMLTNLNVLLELIFAPKLYLLEYAADLLKTVKK